MATVRLLGRANIARSGVLGLLGMAAMAGARAQSPDEGMYYGLGFGPSTYDQNKSELDNEILGAITDSGLTAQNFSSQLDDSDSAFDLLVGYRFGTYFAVEGAYADLGAGEYRASTILSDGTNTAPATFTAHGASTGLVVSAVGVLPFGKRWDAFARGGLIYANTKVDFGTVINGSGNSSSTSGHSTDSALGVGLGCDLTDHFSLRLEYQTFKDVGNSDTGKADIDTVTFHVLYRL